MKAFAVVLALVLGVGCIVAAAWIGSLPAKKDGPVAAPTPTEESKIGPPIAESGPQPKAVVPETDFDFGIRPHLSSGKHAFVIRNEGEAQLVMIARKEDRTCQCTGANLESDKPLGPGEETTIVLEWEIRADVPQFRHSAKIRTNDPNNKIITLSVGGKVEKTFQYDPPGTFWDLGDVSDQTVVKSSRNVFSLADEKFEIRGLKAPEKRFKLTAEPLSAEDLQKYEAKAGYRIDLEADVANFSGAIDESVTVTALVNEKEQSSNLQIRMRKAGPIEFMARNFDPQTNRLSIGEFSANQGKKIEISAYARLEGEVQLKSAKSEHEAIQATWEKDAQFQSKSGKAQRYKLKLELPPGDPVIRRRDDAEKLELTFDRPEIGTMELRVDYLAN